MPDLFNKNMILIARQARGISQTKLSKLSGVTQGHLSKIEHGLTEPSEEVIKNIADALSYPESFFYQTDRMYGLPISVHHPMHRKKAAVGKKALERIEGEINIRLMHIDRLLQSIDMESNFPLPQLDFEEYDGDIERIAQLVRQTWLLPNGPIENVTECFERAGIIVVLSDFSGESVDGITLNAPGRTPCIFINKNQLADRMRFTLCHELGHLVMHQIPNPEMETQANKFASSFLMPSADIKRHLRGRITLQKLAALKPVWKTSIQSLLVRAFDIGAISYNQNRYLWGQINKFKIRLREPPELDFEREKPVILPEIIRIHMEDLEFSTLEISKTLHVYEDELVRLYNIQKDPTDDEKRKKFRVVQ